MCRYSRGTTGLLFLALSGVSSFWAGDSKVLTQPSSGLDGLACSTLGASPVLLVGDMDLGEGSGLRSHGRDFLAGVFGADGGGLAGGGATLSCGGVKPMIVCSESVEGCLAGLGRG